MDSRLDVFAALGLGDGEAHVLRNAGGVITDDVIRSLAISQRRLGTREVMLIHHTDCGMQKVTDDGFRAELQEATGVAPPFAIESFNDVDADVRQSILRVRRSRVPASPRPRPRLRLRRRHPPAARGRGDRNRPLKAAQPTFAPLWGGQSRMCRATARIASPGRAGAAVNLGDLDSHEPN